ncbi:MAG: hypothetical protein JKX76_01645 [Colwellia sp.]|nr:hypothetical protein [Colwellia sp.]
MKTLRLQHGHPHGNNSTRTDIESYHFIDLNTSDNADISDQIISINNQDSILGTESENSDISGLQVGLFNFNLSTDIGEESKCTEARCQKNDTYFFNDIPLFDISNSNSHDETAVLNGIIEDPVLSHSNDEISRNIWKTNVFNTDEKVIIDNKFKMFIVFPLTHPISITILRNSGIIDLTDESNNGFTRFELIKIIQISYERIYNEENETSTQHEFVISNECDGCISIDYRKIVPSILWSTSEKYVDCCVCCEKYEPDEKICKLQCGHLYHEKCIFSWTDKENNNCPMCRSDIMSCNDCNGTKIKSFSYVNSVPRYEHVHNGSRIVTDGEYGIHSHYREDLDIRYLTYNTQTKFLKVNIIPRIF